MSDEELKRTQAALKRVVEEHGSSKEKALAFLVECGIYTPTGELAEHNGPNYLPRA